MKIVTQTLKKNHNVSQESDTSVFLRYIGFFLFLILGIYIFFFLLSLLLVKFISIEDEINWFGGSESLEDHLPGSEVPQSILDRYADIPYELHVIDMDEEENAFAALGGHIYLTQEFINSISYWQELDFIIGHELGHIEHRDILKSLISEIPVHLALSMFGGDNGSTIFTSLISNPHSKIQESSADIFGLDYSYQKNGHIGCALDFFTRTNTLGDDMLELFSTHPMTSARIARAEKYAAEKQYPQGECTPFEL